MKNDYNLIKDFFDYANFNKDTKKLDLTKKEDVEEFHNKIDELRNNEAFIVLAQMFGYDLKDELDTLDEFADKTYAEANKQKFDRPSSKLTIEQGLQIHKLVQEYVDTMIKPFNNGQLSNNQINDAYAGLYEFASWILNK